MGYTLTIAIPTYNRAEKLKFCLQMLLRETTGKPVELLVSDNASTDDTQMFMAEFCTKYPQITYIRNPENIGPDRNFLNCYNRASGDYVMLLGDDDILLSGSVDCILKTLQNRPVFVHMNSSSLHTIDPLRYSAPRIPEGDNRVYDTPEALFQDMGIYVTFLSAFILRTELVHRIPDKEQYIGTYFIQSHIALQTMTEQGSYVFITQNCIAASGNDTVPYDVYFVWGKMYRDLLLKTGMDAGLDINMLRQQHESDLRNQIYYFVRNFRFCCSNSQNWNRRYMLDTIKPYPRLYLKYLPVLYVPVPVWRAIKGLKRIVKRCLGKGE